MTRGARAGCGCSLAGIGAGATLFGFVWALGDFYGDSKVDDAVLIAGLGAMVFGLVLFGLSFRKPD